MHRLSIVHSCSTIVSSHADFADARRALHTHVKRTDTYLHALVAQPGEGLARFALIHLDAAGRRPRLVGSATIQPDSQACCHHSVGSSVPSSTAATASPSHP